MPSCIAWENFSRSSTPGAEIPWPYPEPASRLPDVQISVRPGTTDDIDAITSMDGASFGVNMSPEEVTDTFSVLEIERFLLAMDGSRVVGSTADFPFTMTIPGGTLDVPGVTWVSVEVTHRRKGVLRALMDRQLGDYHAAGIPAAILTASEGGIYGRFGYGVASHIRKTVIARRSVRLAEPGDPSAVERVTKVEARARMPELHERWRAQTSGALDRTPAWWDFLTLDRESSRMGMSEQFYLVHDGGYISYRVKNDWNDGDPRHLCWITDYVIVTPEAHRDLWQVLLGLDLVGSIESYRIPIDDPLRFLVDNGRQIRTTHVGDGLWLRPLDVAAMLSARTYAVELETVLEVVDEQFGDGRYLLKGGPDGASCAPTDRTADVSFDVAALGAAYLGGVRLAPLAAAGRIRADDPGTLSRLDRALLADREPMYGTAF
jgi:predicted acetyltransferase